MHVFIGTDPRDALAYQVAERSILKYSPEAEIHPIKLHDLRTQGIYWRSYRVDKDGQMWDDVDAKPFSTEFSFSRFAVPMMAEKMDIRDRLVLFVDADVMFRANIAELFSLWENDKPLMCVQHDHRPTEGLKMDGVRQTTYMKKNWSSLMLMDWRECLAGTQHVSRHGFGMTPYKLNNSSGSSLHQFTWLRDEDIGALPEEWNYLVGYSDERVIDNPKMVHFTLGTPDMVGKCEYSDEWESYL